MDWRIGWLPISGACSRCTEPSIYSFSEFSMAFKPDFAAKDRWFRCVNPARILMTFAVRGAS